MRRPPFPPLALVLALLAAAPCAALGSRDKGTAGAAFLTLTPGARASALGGAFGGVADDATAAHYNPAGLGFSGRVEAAAGREARFQGLNYDYAVLSVPVVSWTDKTRRATDWGVTAAAVYSLTASGIQRRGLVESDSPTGTFAAADRAYALSYGLALGDSLSVGATAKYVDESLDTAHGGAFTGDAGVLWRSARWSAGAGLRNAFGRLRLGSTADPLPAAAYAGAGWRPGPGWLLALEVDQPRADAAALALGVERVMTVSPGLTAAGRAGYRTDRTDAGVLGGVSVGFGVGWKGLDAEFCWSPGGALGDVFQYSVRAGF
ncbi:MAG: PorV/PorQ family protein [Elusimicrobia bacterium]|nr:PorV/PorQ family protein [Elusimicrobiota bacterium]